jgi:hypothetical protein
LIRIRPPAISPRRSGFSARNDPQRRANVARKNVVKMIDWRRSVFQKTSAKPSDPYHSAST